MSIPVLVNEQAARGAGRSLVDRAIGYLRSVGADVELVTADTPTGLLSLARACVASSPERVLVMGGDGTVHTLLPALAGSGVPVGLVPFGTRNDFARGLGLATDGIEAALDNALGLPIAVDLGRAADRWFASVATLGFPTRVNARANRLRWPKGGRRYTVATLLEIGRLAPVAVALTVDGVRHDVEATLVAVANTGYFGGGMKVCPGADPTDGLLDVTIVGRTGRVELLRFFPKVFGGDHLGHRAVTTRRGREVVIEPADQRVETWADGEPLLTGAATLAVHSGGLLVAGARRHERDSTAP